MADDKLAVELVAIRERQEVGIKGVVPNLIGPVDPVQQIRALAQLADVDVPRLLAAVDAALSMAVQWVADADELDRDIGRARKSHYKSDHEQADTDVEVVRTHREHAEALRDAIARELTGKAADHG